MSRSRVAFLWALLLPAAAAAGELELGVFAGRAFPTYEQTFDYNPGSFSPPLSIPGISISQNGTFDLKAKGGLAIGASLALFPVHVLGLEGRVDSVGLRVDTTGRYTATVSSAFLPSFTASVDLPPGQVDVDRLTPISLGFKLRTPGRVRLFVGAGGSYLPKLQAKVTQSLAVQLDGITLPLDVSQLSIVAQARAGEGGGLWGVTAGAGIQIPLGDKVSFQAEARAFRFEKQTLVWGRQDDILVTSALEESLKGALAALDPVEFRPTFFQATAGFALRF